MGTTVAEMARRFRAISLTEEASEIISRNPEEILNLNRDQLRQGKGKDGQYLLRYSEDPFFKTPAAALAYAKWKEKINPNSEKPFDVPDLFINGYTYASLKAVVSGGNVLLSAQVPWAAELDVKYSGNYLGLNVDSQDEYRQVLIPRLAQAIKDKTGAK